MNVRAKSTALLAMMAIAAGAFAQEADSGSAPFTYTELSSEPSPQWNLATTSTPGLRLQATRWTQTGPHAFGFVLGMDSSDRMRPGFGLRWRSRINERQRLDVSTWRQLQAEHDDALSLIDNASVPPVTTRVELQFAPPKPNALGAELGAIGMQLSGDSKLQMKIRRGGPMLYYRMRF